MKTVFIVDDSETSRMSAKLALDEKYKTYSMPSAEKMFKLAKKITPDIILLDIEMPDMNGFEAMEAMKTDENLRQVPVIFLTGKNDEQTEILGFDMGALDFVNKPFSAPVLIRRIETHIETDRLIKNSLNAVRNIHNATIKVIADMVESRDKITGGHIQRTQKYIEYLINELIRTGTYGDEISKWDLTILLPSAQLHDVGKISISDLILNKPGKLTDDEYEIIKTHCIEGEHIIDRILNETGDDQFLLHAKRFAGAHHEKWDGTGYPHKLKGDMIPLEGRIMAIADVYDALVTERPYKKPFTHEKAVEIIKNDSGTHFDPKIVEAFLAVEAAFRVKSISALNNQP